MGNSTTAARQPVGFSRPITPESDNRSNGALPSETIMPLPGEAGYLQAFLDSARKKSGTVNGETRIAQQNGDLFKGPDTADFNQPTLEQQALQFGNAQSLNPQAWTEQSDQKPRTFADALRSAGGTKTNPEQSPAANPFAEQPKPMAPTKAELFAEMNKQAEQLRLEAIQHVQAEIAQEIQEAKRVTVQLKNTAPALRNAALGLENNQHNAGVGKNRFAHQLAMFAKRVLARQENLAQLAREDLAAKNAKKNQGGAEAGMPAKGPEVTAYIQRTTNTDNEQSGQNAGA